MATRTTKSKEPGPIYRTYEDFPFEDLCTYAGLDCLATSGIMAKIFPKVAERRAYQYSEKGNLRLGHAPAILDFMEQVEMPAHEFILDMEIHGMLFDQDNCRAQCKKIEAELPVLEEEIYRLFGRRFNCDSGTELAKILYQELKFEPPSLTKSGQPSTDGDALASLADEHNLEWLKVLAKRNNLASVWRTFFRTYIEDFVKPDGRIHPSYNLFGTSSFRITGDTPNLTQLPNAQTESRVGYSVRRNFIVPPGYLFLCADFSSAEVKILGALCKDPKLLKAIEEGKDFHSYSASAMRGIPYDEFVAIVGDKHNPLNKQYKAYRQYAKALTFGILYGSSVRGIAHTLKITEDEANKLIALYFKEFPLIEVYVKDAHRMAQLNHRVLNSFGQAKQEFGAMNIFKNTAVYNASLRNAQNVRVQSTASTVGLAAFTELNRQIKPLGGFSLCTVYDSVELEIPIPRAAECIETVFRCMDDWPVQTYDWLDLPIGCDVEIGFNWENMAHVHRGMTQDQVMHEIIKLAA